MKQWKLETFVRFSLAITILYTIAEYVSGWFDHPHDILTGCVYGFFAGEVVSCALIKIFKLKNDNTDDIGNDSN